MVNTLWEIINRETGQALIVQVDETGKHVRFSPQLGLAKWFGKIDIDISDLDIIHQVAKQMSDNLLKHKQELEVRSSNLQTESVLPIPAAQAEPGSEG